jgi:hypothetical protein
MLISSVIRLGFSGIQKNRGVVDDIISSCIVLFSIMILGDDDIVLSLFIFALLLSISSE